MLYEKNDSQSYVAEFKKVKGDKWEFFEVYDDFLTFKQK